MCGTCGDGKRRLFHTKKSGGRTTIVGLTTFCPKCRRKHHMKLTPAEKSMLGQGRGIVTSLRQMADDIERRCWEYEAGWETDLCSVGPVFRAPGSFVNRILHTLMWGIANLGADYLGSDGAKAAAEIASKNFRGKA